MKGNGGGQVERQPAESSIGEQLRSNVTAAIERIRANQTEETETKKAEGAVPEAETQDYEWELPDGLAQAPKVPPRQTQPAPTKNFTPPSRPVPQPPLSLRESETPPPVPPVGGTYKELTDEVARRKAGLKAADTTPPSEQKQKSTTAQPGRETQTSENKGMLSAVWGGIKDIGKSIINIRNESKESYQAHIKGWSQPKSPLGQVVNGIGNAVYDVLNGAGAIAKAGCTATAGIIQTVTKAADMPLKTAREGFRNAQSTTAKVGWGIATAGAAVLRTAMVLPNVAAKSLKSAGSLMHEGSVLVGSGAKLILNPSAESLKATGSALTRTGAEFAMTMTAVIKGTGTELKKIGIKTDVPYLTGALRVMGGALQAASQATDGVIQGVRKAAVLERGGGDLIVAGFKSAGATVKNDLQTARRGHAETREETKPQDRNDYNKELANSRVGKLVYGEFTKKEAEKNDSTKSQGRG